MSLRGLLSRLLSVFLPLAITSSIYLYLYPVFHRCAFPLPETNNHGGALSSSFLNTIRHHISPESAAEPAIFRLLVLADPQLEGDSSLPKPENQLPARLKRHWGTIKTAVDEQSSPVHRHVFTAVLEALHTIAAEDIPRAVRAARKRLDLLGNDYYLAHVYRTIYWWTQPTHVTVLGDLIGSQWVTDEEFDRRGHRYWDRVFQGGERVDDEITAPGARGYEGSGVELETLNGSHEGPWTRRIINIVGNHDVGYSGDASESRIERFERMFGRSNWDVKFRHPMLQQTGDSSNTSSSSSSSTTPTTTPTLHLINLNTLTLDAPAFSSDIQANSYSYINDLITKRSYPVDDRTTFTLLLTHLPLHKREGICTDGPHFTFFDADDENGPDDTPRYLAGGLREQNHLSEQISATGILQGIFGMSGDEDGPGGGWGRNGLILTGHDHTGCDVVHYVERSPAEATGGRPDNATEEPEEEHQPWRWEARRFGHPGSAERAPSIREVTLRSMMGEYGGYAGLLSLWFDADPAVNEWKYEITMCAAGVQHIWWAVHVVDLVTVLLLVVYSLTRPAKISPEVKAVSKNGRAPQGKGKSKQS
ncbi:hypothetical protein FE257_002365 [Aspergillus nanangensis]|uniref:Uncharacterized protein n=1 Tax=Aspergillus nanangensis TaxID=2582783 RepID=A0AAD4CE18_ASPNN|nr:hypothetical protein FE257_002365 [Aspergillus nanangensis]